MRTQIAVKPPHLMNLPDREVDRITAAAREAAQVAPRMGSQLSSDTATLFGLTVVRQPSTATGAA
ncbi:hypothetical protein ACVW00_000634 [Marmoricola sp. URHA0025 HA25]